MAIHLLIKGNVSDALKALSKRGLLASDVKPLSSDYGQFGEYTVATVDPTYEPVVLDYMNEPGEAPYPPGSLLFFRVLPSFAEATDTQPTRSFRVSWSIDIDAATPEQAAREARRIQQDPQSTATVFEVSQDGQPTKTVDLA